MSWRSDRTYAKMLPPLQQPIRLSEILNLKQKALGLSLPSFYPLMANSDLGEMSDLSPQSASKRTSITLLSPIAIYEYTPLERSPPPVLLRLALHCCASRVLHLEPVW
jgi:hypothetical protein